MLGFKEEPKLKPEEGLGMLLALGWEICGEGEKPMAQGSALSPRAMSPRS